MVAWEMMHNGTLRGISDGSTHYHATYVKSVWRKDIGMTLVGRIGSHIFIDGTKKVIDFKQSKMYNLIIM